MAKRYILFENKAIDAELPEIVDWDESEAYADSGWEPVRVEVAKAEPWQKRIGSLRKVKRTELDIFAAAEDALGARPTSAAFAYNGFDEPGYTFYADSRTVIGTMYGADFDKYRRTRMDDAYVYEARKIGAVEGFMSDRPITVSTLGEDDIAELIIEAVRYCDENYGDYWLESGNETIAVLAKALAAARSGATVTAEAD